jgi:hypothetical protein
LDRLAGSAGPLYAAAAQTQNQQLETLGFLTGLPAFEAQQCAEGGIRRLAKGAGLRKKRGRRSKNTKEGEQTMNGTVAQAVLWIVAGFFLTLLIIRRGKRKASKS